MVYSQKVRDIISKSINSRTKLTNVKYPEGYSQINYSDISIVFCPAINGKKKECIFNTLPGKEKRVDSEYLGIWKQYAPGKFMTYSS